MLCYYHIYFSLTTVNRLDKYLYRIYRWAIYEVIYHESLSWESYVCHDLECNFYGTGFGIKSYREATSPSYFANDI